MNYGKVNACIADSVAVSTTPASGTILAVGGIVGCNRRTTATVDDDCFAVNVSVSAAGGNEKGAIAGRIDNAGYTGGNFYDTGSLSGTGTGGDSTTQVCKLVVPTDVRIMGTDAIEYDDEMYAAGSVTLNSTQALATASGNLSGSGGVYSYNMSADTTIGFSGETIIDGLKYNSAGGYYEINSAADLQVLSTYVTDGHNCSGLTFKQTRDIDMSTVENYTGIGVYQADDTTASKRFAGTFDGGNFKISNLSINSTRNYEGLFSVLHSNGIIQNVNIVDANITCKMAGGAIVGDCHGTIKNCTVTGNNTITVTGTNESYAGGIAGYCYNTTELNISNCKVDGVKLSTAGTKKAEGGIVGVIWNYPAAIDSDCLAVNVTASEDTGNMGAVVGWIQSGTAVVNGYYCECGELAGVGNKNTGTDSTAKAYRLSVPFGISVASGTVFNGNGNTYASGDLTFTGTTSTGDLYVGTTKLAAASGTYSYTVTSDTILSEYPRIDGLIFNRAEGYFEITSAEDMQILADHVNAGNTCVGIKFKVMNDIDMSTIDNFTAIGKATAAYQFQGEFDGDNYAISNLKIDKNAIDQGLFGYVGSDGIIENVKLVDATVKGQRDVGGIVGENNGIVRNCMAVGGTIENGYAHATANWAAAGGVVGWGRYGTIENCIADSVTAKSTFTADDETVKDVAVGGVVGVKSFSSTLGGNCLAINVTATVGDTTTNGRVGAFLGQIYSNSTTDVEGYFYTGGNNSLAGLGKNSSSSTATVTQVYKFDLNGNAVEASGGITYNDAIYAASDTAISFSGTPSTGNWFVNNIKMSAADGTYSYTMTAKDAILTDAAFIEGLTYNAAGDYFEIASAADLNALATYVNNGNDCTGITFKQTQDITFGSEDAHTAIGKNSANQFKGTFDGQGKTISNLKAIAASEDQGLFGYVGANGTVKNVNLANAEITGYENVGGIVGFNYGSVSDCSVVNSSLEATRTSASDEYVGGIVGRNHGSVNKCIVDTLTLTTASECTKARVGGLIGYTYDGTLDSDCLALNVSMNVDAENAGALIGRLRSDSKTTVLGNYYNCVNGDGTTALKGVGYNYQGTDSTRQVYKFDLGDNTVEVSGGITYGGAIYAPSGTTLTFTGTSETGNWYVDNVKLTASGNTYSYKVGTADATLTDTVSIDGFSYNEAGNYFEIETAADLEHLSSYVLNGNSTSGLTFKQIADIDMSSVANFTPIGNGATQFKGTFDGNGKTIDNLTVNAATD